MEPFRTILKQLVPTLILGAAAIVLSYYYLDRPAAYFVHNHGINTIPFFHWVTYIPMVFNVAAPLAATSGKGWDAVVRNNLYGGFLFSRECPCPTSFAGGAWPQRLVIRIKFWMLAAFVPVFAQILFEYFRTASNLNLSAKPD